MTTGRINQVSILSNLTHDAQPWDRTSHVKLTLPSRARVIDWIVCVLGTPHRLTPPGVVSTQLKSAVPEALQWGPPGFNQRSWSRIRWVLKLSNRFTQVDPSREPLATAIWY